MFKRSSFIALFYIIALFNTENSFARQNRFHQNSEANTSATTLITDEDQELLASLLFKLKLQLQNIIFCIQQTEQVIGQKKVKLSKKQALKITEELAVIKQVLQSISQELFHSASPEDVHRAAIIIISITSHLKSTFLNIKTISAKNIIAAIQATIQQNRAPQNAQIDLENLKIHIKANNKEIKKFIEQAETLGLTKWNIRWRTFADSKWTYRAKKAAMYGLLGTAFWTLYVVTHDQNTAIPFTSWTFKDLWRPFGLWKENSENHFQQKSTLHKTQMYDSLSSVAQRNITVADHMLNDTHLTQEGRNFAQHLKEKACLNLAEAENNYSGKVSFAAGTMGALSHFIPSTALLVAICSPLLIYPQAIVEKIKSFFDTKQDLSELEKWTKEKYKEMIRSLRGEKTHQYIDNSEETISLDDIVGGEKLKEVAMTIFDYLKHPKKYEQSCITLESGILLYGPPQTGKTMFARALQMELQRQIPDQKVGFLQITSNELNAFSIEEIFEAASNWAPCIIFIDEIDIIGASRNSPNPARSRELLTSLSKIMEAKASKKVFLIAATNQPENMDFALTVKGRFGIEIALEYPTYKNRLTYLKRQLQKRGVTNLSEDFIDNLAKETEGKTYNDLSSVINDAFAQSMRELRMVTQNDFEIAFDRQLRNIMPMNALSERELQIISTYQIGLGLMRHLLHTKNEVNCLTILPVQLKIKHSESTLSFNETNSSKNFNHQLLTNEFKPLTTNGFVFTTESGKNSTFLSDEEVKNEIIVLLAGQAALKLITGNYYSEYMKEHNAKSLNMIKNSISKGEENTENVVKAALELKVQYQKEALELLAPYKDIIEQLAQTLVEKQLIRAEEWQELLEKLLTPESNQEAGDNENSEIDVTSESDNAATTTA